jgi:hypothetical protein
VHFAGGDESDTSTAQEKGWELVEGVKSAEGLVRVEQQAQWLLQNHADLVHEDGREAAVQAVLTETTIRDHDKARAVVERALNEKAKDDALNGTVKDLLDAHPEWMREEKREDAVRVLAATLGTTDRDAARRLGWAIGDAIERAKKPPARSETLAPTRLNANGEARIMQYLTAAAPDMLKPENQHATVTKLQDAYGISLVDAEALVEKARAAQQPAPPEEREHIELELTTEEKRKAGLLPPEPRILSGDAEKALLDHLSTTKEELLNPLDPFVRYNAIDLIKRTYNISSEDAEKYLDQAAKMKVFGSEQLALGASYIADRHPDWLDPANREAALDAIVRINHDRYSREEAGRLLDYAIVESKKPKPVGEEGIRAGVQWILQNAPEILDDPDRQGVVRRIMNEAHITEDDAREVLRRAWFERQDAPPPLAPRAATEPLTPEQQENVVQWLLGPGQGLLQPDQADVAVRVIMDRMQISNEDAQDVFVRACNLHAAGITPRAGARPEARHAMTDAEKAHIAQWAVENIPDLSADPAKAEEQIRAIMEKMEISEEEAKAAHADALRWKGEKARIIEWLLLHKPDLDPDPSMRDRQVQELMQSLQITEAEARLALDAVFAERGRREKLEHDVAETRTAFATKRGELRRQYTAHERKAQVFGGMREALFSDAKFEKGIDAIMDSVYAAAGLSAWSNDPEKQHSLTAQLATTINTNPDIPPALRDLATEVALARAAYSACQREHGALVRDELLRTVRPGVPPSEIEMGPESERQLNLSLYEKLVLEEGEKLNQEMLALYPPKDRAGIVKGVGAAMDKWRSIPAPVRWTIVSTLTAVGIGTGLISVGALAIGWRIARPVIGGATAWVSDKAVQGVFNYTNEGFAKREAANKEHYLTAFDDVVKHLDAWKDFHASALARQESRQRHQQWVKAAIAVTAGGLAAWQLPKLGDSLTHTADAATAIPPGTGMGTNALADRPAGAPRLSADAPPGQLTPAEIEKLAQAETVQHTQGIWQPVREQLRFRLQENPAKFGLKPEDLNNAGKVRAVLDQQTSRIIEQNKMMNLGIRHAGEKVLLHDDNTITFGDKDATYVMRPRVSHIVESRSAAPRVSDIADRNPAPGASANVLTETPHIHAGGADAIQPQETVPFHAPSHDDLPGTGGKPPVVQDVVKPSTAETATRIPDAPPRPVVTNVAEAVVNPQQIERYVSDMSQQIGLSPAEFASTSKLRVGDFLTTMNQQPAAGSTFTFGQGSSFTVGMSHDRFAQTLELVRKQLAARATFGSPQQVMEQLNTMSVDDLLRKAFEDGVLRPKPTGQ